MPTTPRLKLVFPDEQSRNWFEGFEALMDDLDAKLFAEREDRNLAIAGGGTLTFNSGTGVLTWSAMIQILAPTTGFRQQVTGPSSVTILDGQVIYLTITRAPQNNVTVALQAGNTVPNEPAGDNQLMFGWRVGSRVHFRDGHSINNGESIVVFDTSGGGGGGGTPGGVDNDIQIKETGTFAADSGNFTYDPALHSMTGGVGSTAAGSMSISFGNVCVASGAKSCAIGNGCTASGNQSVALGDSNTSSGVASFSAGSSNVVSGNDAGAIGLGNSATGAKSFAAGNANTASNTAAIAMGDGNTASGLKSIALGQGCTVTGLVGFAWGDACTAPGTVAIALGESAHATRVGEFAHASQGNLNYEGTHWIDLIGHGNGAPVDLVQGDSAEFTADNNKTFKFVVEVLAYKLGGAGPNATETLICLGSSTGGTLTLDANQIQRDALPLGPPDGLQVNGWTVTVSAPAGLTLRIHCDPGPDDVKFMARLRWLAMPNV